MWDLIVLVPDHYLSFYFVVQVENFGAKSELTSKQPSLRALTRGKPRKCWRQMILYSNKVIVNKIQRK